MLNGFLTVGELAKELGVPAWKTRRVVDSLGHDISRVGGYRMIPRKMVAKVRLELKKTGWFEETKHRTVASRI